MSMPLRSWIAIVAAALAICGDGPARAQSIRNTGKYGAMFSWWYTELPADSA